MYWHNKIVMIIIIQNDDAIPELGADTGMTESDLGGEDFGTTVSDLENDTDINNNNQTD